MEKIKPDASRYSTEFDMLEKKAQILWRQV